MCVMVGLEPTILSGFLGPGAHQESTMNWISEVVRPKIKTLFKRETPDNLWIKCPDTGQMVFHKDVEANDWVIPGSNHHLKMSAVQRL